MKAMTQVHTTLLAAGSRLARISVLAALFAGASHTAVAASIAGTPHDLSTRGWGTTELCKFCHTPHLAQAVSGAPLWNHRTTAATYTLYSSASFKGTSTQP